MMASMAGIMASSPLWTPVDSSAYSNLITWHDASDTATITDTGGLVDQWDDKKNANDVTQTGAARPTTNSVTIGGLNAIDFNGSHSLSKTGATDIGTGAQAFTVIFIAEMQTGMTGDGGLFGYGTNVSAQLIGISQRGNTTNEMTNRFFNGYVECDTTWTNGTVQIGVTELAASANYSAVNWWINGTSTGVTNNNTNSLNLSATKNLTFGDYSGGSDFFNGKIGEILFFDAVLTQAQREEFEGYLAHKWSQEANLPGGHPYKAAPP